MQQLKSGSDQRLSGSTPEPAGLHEKSHATQKDNALGRDGYLDYS